MNYSRILLVLLVAILTGCAIHFDERRKNENISLINFNGHEVQLLEINNTIFPEDSYSMEVPSGLVKIKVRLHWIDSNVGALYTSPEDKYFCFNALPGYTYTVMARGPYIEGLDWEPYLARHEDSIIIDCPIK